ncbi:hypothetical protein LWC35_31985 [Pseudonocardia kujensis]|uniref:hypothetical protein n=1 Tax=Pseudonocardia kujensis TaxID=1128675 RepID=UPI001E5C7E47|nr:hypothetical protein [Pseudonocardia kujensis]MCE0767482.1 hypothetical protein [Pseudonocardia kujensis]
MIVVGFGSADEHAAAMAPLREALAPLFEVRTPIPYVGLQQMLDEAEPWGIHAYAKGLYLDAMPDEVVDTLAERPAFECGKYVQRPW